MVDYNDPEYVEWVCEQIGVEYKGLPLTHHQKQRFLAMKSKSPYLEFPGRKPTKKMEDIMKTTRVTAADSKSVENILIDQYDREIEQLLAQQDKCKRMIQEITSKVKNLKVKRSKVAKIVQNGV